MSGKADWTGVERAEAPVAPLTPETFVERLRLLSARARDIQVLRQAMRERQETK